MTSAIACAKSFVSKSMDRWFNEQESSEQPSSSSAAASPRRHDLLDTYGRSFCGVDNGGDSFQRATTVPGLAYSKGAPYVEIQDFDVLRWASSNPAPRQFYQEAGDKSAVFTGCKTGETELRMSKTSSNMMSMPINIIGHLLSEEMAQSSRMPSESALAPPPPQVMQQQQAECSRPSSSSSSLRSISVGSPECSSFLRNMGGGATSSCQQLSDAADPAQGLAHPLVPTPTATAATYSRFRDTSTSQLPSPRSDDVALMKAMVAVLSNPLSQPQPSPSVTESNKYPSTPSPQAATAGVGRAGAFRPYRLGPFPRRFKPAGSSTGHSMIRKLHGILRFVDEQRAEKAAADVTAAHASAKAPTSNQLHHMISERRRREKLNESFQALRALLPPGTKRDKASVLATTKDYLANLKVQISDLEEKNRVLESKLPLKDKVEEVSTSLMETPNTQITLTSHTTEEVQEMNLILSMRVECDVLDVVLGILERIKEARFLSLVSMDVDYIPSSQIMKAKFTLNASKGAEWDEGVFKEAVAAAVDEVVSRRA